MNKINIHDLNSYIGQDERGWMVSLMDGDWVGKDIIKNIHLGTIKPGKLRGNHYHGRQKEWLFVFGGRAIFAWRDDEGVNKKEISKKDFLLFEAPAGVTHSIKNIDSHDIYVCAFTNNEYNRESPDKIDDKIL